MAKKKSIVKRDVSGGKAKSKSAKASKSRTTPGGETHQTAKNGQQTLTTQQGMPVSDNQNSLRMGERGPGLLEDQVMREKIFHFDHERIPERVVHARGYGARGYFEVTKSLKDISCAHLFQDVGQRTEVFTRFSTVAGSSGSPDLARDVRGFAVKFYTEEGNWDLVGNNIPVFFIQDAMKFPDLIHAVKPEPDRGFPQAQSAHDNFWDFISLMPESMHMVMWAMSDRTIPRSLRFMEGFGVHTFRLINSKARAKYVKFHWKPSHGLQSVLWDEAVKINGADPDYHRRDLWNAIDSGDYPEWELGVQVFDDAFADEFDFDVLDATKLIPEELVPIRPIGKLVLNKNVDNFFAETEQVAFCTQNIVKGIDFTNDPLLQGRNFSYLDTQLKRLGSPNFTHIPVNAPRCPVALFHQDGHMAMKNPSGRVNYEPNSWSDSPNPREDHQRGFVSHPTSGDNDGASGQPATKGRQRSKHFADHYSQARQFFDSQNPIEQHHIIDALVFELSKVETPAIRERMLASLINVDKNLAQSVATGLGVTTLPKALKPKVTPRKDLPVCDSLSILKTTLDTISGRAIGVLVSEGTKANTLKELKRVGKQHGVNVKCIAQTIDGVQDSNGNAIDIAEMIKGGPSVLFDAIVLIPAEDAVESLLAEPAVSEFLADADVHKKFVLYADTASSLLEHAGIDAPDERAGYIRLGSKKNISEFVDHCYARRCWDR